MPRALPFLLLSLVFLSFLLGINLFGDLGLGFLFDSVHLIYLILFFLFYLYRIILFPSSSRVRVRVLFSVPFSFPLLFFWILFWIFFSDPNEGLFFSCRASAKMAVWQLSPRGGGGDWGSSDVRHPGLFSICFYPISVRVTHWQPGSGTIVRNHGVPFCNRRSGVSLLAFA